MNAFTELAIFCGEHPEIRAHKRIGELLQATAAELAQLQKRLDVACHVKSKDKVGFDWEILDTIAQLRDELDKCVAWNEDEDSPHAQFEQTIAQLRAELDEERNAMRYIRLHPAEAMEIAGEFLKTHPGEIGGVEADSPRADLDGAMKVIEFLLTWVDTALPEWVNNNIARLSAHHEELVAADFEDVAVEEFEETDDEWKL